MKMQKLLAMLCLIGLTLPIALTAAESVSLGPANVSMDLQGIGTYNIVRESPTSLNHNFGGYIFPYEIFSASIKSNNTTNQVLVDVHQMGGPQSLSAPVQQLNTQTGLEHCIEESGIMPAGNGIKKEQYSIDGQEGLLVTINRTQKMPIYIAAYSPDLRGGSGKTVVIIGSDFPWNTTKSLFESVKTKLYQSNATNQSNMTGPGIMSMSNMSGQGGIIVQGNLIVQGDLVINMVPQGSEMGQGGMMAGGMMGNSDMMAMMQSCMAMMRSMMGPSRWDQGNTAASAVNTAAQGNMASMSNLSAENTTLEQANMSAVNASGEPAKDIHGH